MARFALGTLRQLEACMESRCVSMHLSSGMTVHTSHILFGIVHICRVVSISACHFPVNPTTMTAGAGGVHRWLFLKGMSRQKSTIYIIRTADVALTATRMAGITVFVFCLQNLVQDFPVFLIGTGLDNLGEWIQSVVEATFGCRDNFLVAFSAGLVCCWEGGIFYDFPVGSVPVRINRITSVAGLAAYLSMLGLQKRWMYVDLLVQLQRSQGPRSSFPRRLS